jgi:hypothetical protein
MKLEPNKLQGDGYDSPTEKNWRDIAAVVFVFIGVFYWVIKIVF